MDYKKQMIFFAVGVIVLFTFFGIIQALSTDISGQYGIIELIPLFFCIGMILFVVGFIKLIADNNWKPL